MILKTKVAVTGVSNLHDARYCAGMFVDWVAFPIDTALPNSVSKEDFAEIIGWVTGPLFFGEVGAAEDLELSDFQIDGIISDNPEILSRFGGEMTVVWRVDLNQKDQAQVAEELKAHSQNANWFLLETSDDIDTIDLEWLKGVCEEYPVVLSANFSPESANQAIDTLSPLGIGLRGGKELKVGLNDFDGLADVLEAIEVED